MNRISCSKKLFRDDRWLVLNGNYIAILETKGEASDFFPYIVSWMTWIGVTNASSSSSKGRSPPPQFSAHVYCGQTVAHLSYC